MTGAMRDALELIRSLKKQYPDETEDQLVSRFQKELDDWKQCELLFELIERIGANDVRSLEALSEKEGKAPHVIWAEMCKERGSNYAAFPSAC